MHKVSQGEENLTTTDPRTTAGYGNSNWAEEFIGVEGITKEPQQSADQDWTKEFVANPQPDLADEWTREFSGNLSLLFLAPRFTL